MSAQLKVGLDDPREAVARRASHTVQAGCQHVILYIDPRIGPTWFRQVATEVVAPLRDRVGA